MRTVAILVAAVVAVTGCQDGVAGPRDPAPAPPPSDPPPDPAGRDLHMREHMRANYDLARAIDRLLIRGQLAGAQDLARLIAIAPVPYEMTSFAAEREAVRQRATEVMGAPSLDEALRRQARLASACGSCHRTAGVSPEFGTSPPVPAEADTVEARMQRHWWAADRLWDGATGGSDSSWLAGLEVLAATPASWPGLSSRAAFARRLHELADSARRDAGGDLLERTRVHGELLVTCAACHTLDDK